MTQRKFKHVGREDCFAVPHENKENPVNYDIWVGEVQRGTIPHWIVENYNDWQEITPELVEGRWYKDNIYVGRWDGEKHEVTNQPIFNNVYDLVGGYVIGYAAFIQKNLVEATPDEIHKALDAIRIEKGLVEGVNMISAKAGLKRMISNNPDTTYSPNHDRLWVNVSDVTAEVSTIYEKGVWATKVSEPILVTEDLQNFKQDFWDQFNKLCDKYFGHE